MQVTIPANLEGEARAAIVKRLLERWYRERSTKKLQERTDVFAPIVGAQPKIVKVRAYSARWGSCSREDIISYNWRTIMTPSRIIDYVVVHELCHLLEHNHSPAFWARFAAVCQIMKSARDGCVNATELLFFRVGRK